MKTTLISLLSATFLLANAAFAGSDVARPNILLILTDDQGYADVGFNNQQTDVVTPNLDALANNGLVFNSAYVAHPFCGPSRAALMTGRYPHKIGSQFNLPVGGSSTGIDVNETFISKTLQQAGYFTGAIGKWHLGELEPYHPNNRGFDEFYGFLGGGHDYFPSQYRPKYEHLKKQGITRMYDYITPLQHNGKEVRESEYITDALSREAIRFINTAADNKQQPFFLYLAYNAPHVPLEATEEDLARFAHIKDKKRRTYAAMVYAVDRGIENITKALKDSGQFDNTLIVFLSDNGGNTSKGGVNTPLREGKGSAHEGGHRVPMMVHWPDGLARSGNYAYPVSALDLYPTFANLAGAELNPGKILDGVDIWPHLMANTSARAGQSLFMMRHRTAAHDVSVRRDQWKAVRTKKTGKWQLFDIENDMSEKHDLSAKHPRILEDMIRDIAHWSWSNVPPRWFHIHEEGDLWRQHDMPRFSETFTNKQ
ncbi:sulfatase-like hydrolase/transferase [Thalassotalea mangrovi]|uniref:Sulfatase n=1 Tax=Thalassotalea mangrovi TaxID=2572245 RepID=A0A4U1B260_9GAMM|nr:sulfatase-like hydrolase/transferase [Thalassotalea mangrovi]TKB43674.1 sulfatase [Thalassotalea mangrovi]